MILINHSEKTGFEFLGILGLIIWLKGFIFEAMGDYQLSKFKRTAGNKGKIMTRGLWRFTRHPNYFGEAVIWLGIFLIALPVKSGWTAIVSPLMLTFLLLRVSGITMLEKKYVGNKEFEEYSEKTNAFFPWYPKKP